LADPDVHIFQKAIKDATKIKKIIIHKRAPTFELLGNQLEQNAFLLLDSDF